jgi:hypothetical protein
MIRLCILGNSHAGALKQASADFCAAHPEAVLTFFAAVAFDSRAMAVQDGQYVPLDDALAAQYEMTSGGLRAIDPAQYDAFLVYGFGGRSLPLDRPRAYSQAFRAACTLTRLQEDLIGPHLQALRGLTDKPLFAALKPLPCPQDGRRPRRLLPHHEEVALAQRHICDPLGAQMVAQPAATRIDDRATHPDFASGSARLVQVAHPDAPAHADDEAKHMNAEYGRLWLDAFWPHLRPG